MCKSSQVTGMTSGRAAILRAPFAMASRRLSGRLGYPKKTECGAEEVTIPPQLLSVAMLSPLGRSDCVSCCHPMFRQNLRLFQDGYRGLRLLIWRVAVLSETALHQDAEVGLDVLADGPVDGHVGLDGGYQLAGYVAEGFVA